MDTIMSGLETRVCNFHFLQRCTARARLGEIIKLSSQSFCGFLAGQLATRTYVYVVLTQLAVTYLHQHSPSLSQQDEKLQQGFLPYRSDQISLLKYLLTYLCRQQVPTQFLRFESATYIGLQTVLNSPDSIFSSCIPRSVPSATYFQCLHLDSKYTS